MEQSLKSEWQLDVERIDRDYYAEVADLSDYGQGLSAIETAEILERLRLDRVGRIESLTPTTPFRLLSFFRDKNTF